jgi:HK97 family phage portal protein
LMGILDRIFGTVASTGKAGATPPDGAKRASISPFMEAKASGKRPLTNRPLYSRIGPGQAVTTPRRYDTLAEEGYRQNVIAFRAINLVARGVASIPLTLFRGEERVDEHPLLAVLARPNPRVKGVNFMANLVGFHQIAGNAYVLAVGPDGRPPKELWLLRPDTMSVLEGKNGIPSGFRQQLAGRTQDFAPDHVLHWKTFNPLSDWYGMAPLDSAALAVDAHNEGSRWNLALIQNGGTPSGVLYQEDGETPLTDTQFENLKAQVEEHYTGALNAGRPLLLEGGLKWQDMGMSPKDMDWGSAKNMNAREIAVAFGVPPQMLGIPDSQTYSNYAEARQSVWEETIIPLAEEIVCELNGWLVPQFENDVRAKLKLKLDLDEIPALAHKRAAKFERINSADFLSVNEKRKALGLPPIDGGDGVMK